MALLALALRASPAWAQAIGGQPGEIFSFGAGARALAMGSAYTAVVNDVSSVYYNPAGLGLLPAREISLMRAFLYGDATYDYIAYAQNNRKNAGGWGAEFIQFKVGGASGRDQDNNETGQFGYSERAFGLAAAWRGLLHPRLSLGAKVKMMQRGFSGAGNAASDRLFGIDFGAQMGPWVGERLMLGLIVQNVMGFKQGDTEDSLKLLLRLGAAYKVIGPLSVAADVSNNREFRVGTEYSIGFLALRVGLAQQGMTFGGGLLFKNRYSVDLAMLNHPTLGMSQRISLGYRFAGAAGAGEKSKKMRFYAEEFLANAQAELKKRNYLKALNDFSAGLGIDPKRGAEWRSKTDRLRRLLKRMGLEAHPEDSATLAEDSQPAVVAFAAIESYMGREEERAMTLAHAAVGLDTAKGAFGRLLDSLAALTGHAIQRDQLLPPLRLAEFKMKRAMDAIYARRFEAAVTLLREALWLDPGNVMAWTRLGSAFFASGDRPKAAEAYREALRLNPADEKLRQFVRSQGLE
ncbi:MAG: tetratricopeptide repeat protein [Elusimicrobia bacterium]|nr:tetratricopeptide repeat protein [Elusimicrobiota bacterium]